MDNEQAEHDASKQAAGASVMTEHPDARDHALQAMDHSGDGKSKDAASSHVRAAKVHESAATDARKDGDQDEAQDHDNAAALHRKAASMHQATCNQSSRVSNQRKGHQMIKQATREQLLQLLTANCDCPTEKAAFPSLNTATLRAIALNTSDESGDGSDTDQAGGEEDETDDDDAGITKSDVGKGLKNKHKVGQSTMNMSPQQQEVFNYGTRKYEADKRQLASQLVGNVADPKKRQALFNKFLAKPIAELEEMKAMLPTANEGYIPPGIGISNEAPLPSYLGAAGGPDVTTNAQQQTYNAEDDVLPLPTINWEEAAAEQRAADAAKQRKRQAV